MKKRLRKKLHKRFLDWALDISQNSSWRTQLFAADEGEEFPLDISHLEGVGRALSTAIKRYRLSYRAARVTPTEAAVWLSEGQLIVFRIRAREFPKLRVYSGNNPEVV